MPIVPEIRIITGGCGGAQSEPKVTATTATTTTTNNDKSKQRTFPVFVFSSSPTSTPTPEVANQRPECFMRSLSSLARGNGGFDTPSPKSPLSQANYLCPKESTRLLGFEAEEQKESLQEVNITPPILTLSDIKLEVRTKAVERILIDLMQKVSGWFFVLLFRATDGASGFGRNRKKRIFFGKNY